MLDMAFHPISETEYADPKEAGEREERTLLRPCLTGVRGSVRNHYITEAGTVQEGKRLTLRSRLRARTLRLPITKSVDFRVPSETVGEGAQKQELLAGQPTDSFLLFVLKNAFQTNHSSKYAKPDNTQAKQSSTISGAAR